MSWQDPYLVKLESLDPRGYLDLLNEMVKFPTLHNGLVQHSKTPSNVLVKILALYQDSVSVPIHLLGNPNCPREFVEKSISALDPGSQQMIMLATNENLNRDDLNKLKTFPDLAASLAGRSNLPPDLFIYIWENYLIDLEYAAFGLNMPLLEALACNPKTPIKILRNLSKYDLVDSPLLIKSLLMSNPALPSDLKTEFALMGFAPTRNVLDKSNSEWFPTNKVFSINGFSEHLLVLLVNLGHPGGYLRTDVLPPTEGYLDSEKVFDMWLSDQSIYKTLWPELRDIQPIGADFKRWLDGGQGQSYFEIAGLDFEHEDKFGAFNYHATSPYYAQDLIDWLPIEINYQQAMEDFSYVGFSEAAQWGELDWILAWSLSNCDSDYISLVEENNEAYQFIWDQSMDWWDVDRELNAVIDDELVKPYSWKSLSSEKKSFLIEFIRNVYIDGEGVNYTEYAEHFLICIVLNPYTDDDLVDKYFVEQPLESDLINEAIELRKARPIQIVNRG